MSLYDYLIALNYTDYEARYIIYFWEFSPSILTDCVKQEIQDYYALTSDKK